MYTPHYAIDDARTAAVIVITALNYSNTNIEEWIAEDDYSDYCEGRSLLEVDLPDHKKLKTFNQRIKITAPDSKGVIVFTGELSISRENAIEKAIEIGYSVGADVTKKTTILVVGKQDPSLLAGYEKSSKHRKAEELIKAGQNIRIIGEDDFFAMLKL